MKVLVVLLASLVAVFSQNVVRNHDRLANWPSKARACSRDGFRYGAVNEAANVYYKAEAKHFCIPGWRFYLHICACLQDQNAPQRPYCEAVFTMSGQENRLPVMKHNKHITYVGTNTEIKQSSNNLQVCFTQTATNIATDNFAAGTYAQIDWTAGNDFGVRMTLNFIVSSSGTVSTTGNLRTIIATNGYCDSNSLPVPTFEVSYTPSSDTYQVRIDRQANEATCSMGRNRVTNQAYSTNDDVRIRYDNGVLTYNVRNVGAANVGCAQTLGVNILPMEIRLNGTMCGLKLGAMGPQPASNCFSGVALNRDCDVGVLPNN